MRKRRWRVRWLALSVTFGLAVAVTVWWSPVDRVIVWHWRVRLATADDSAAARIVERIAAQGDVGLDILAELLGSARTSVLQSARHALRRELDQWPRLDPEVRAERAVRLAQALAEHVEQFKPASRRIASDFAARILRETVMTRGPQRQQLVTACEQVLRTSILERRQAQLAALTRGTGRGSHGERNDDEQGLEPLSMLASQLAGGGLPLESLQHTGLPSDAVAQDDEANRAHEPAPDADEPGRLAADAAANEGARAPQPSVDDDPRLLPAAEQQRNNEDPGIDPTDTLRWMHALHSGDLELRARAEEELERQGFKALQLELARQLTDSDPRIRRALAESLPAMPGIDAHVWLVWLSRDENADVRLAAMGVMATTADPNVIRRLEQMARTDVDPRIQRQGERLLGQRATAGRPVAR